MTHLHLADKDKLMSELRTVIQDAEELLRMTADQVGDSAEGIRARMTARLHQATNELHHLQHVAVTQAKADVQTATTNKASADAAVVVAQRPDPSP